MTIKRMKTAYMTKINCKTFEGGQNKSAQGPRLRNWQKWLDQQVWPDLELQKFPSLDGDQNKRVQYVNLQMW